MLSALVLTSASAGVVRGQQAGTNILVSATNAAAIRDAGTMALPDRAAPELRLAEPTDTNTLEYTVSKTKVRVSGPLVGPLKARGASDLAHRVFRLVNPLSSSPPNVSPAASGPVNTRAWSTIVGWNPGRSAFPDGAWHEPPQLRLVSFTAEKEP